MTISNPAPTSKSLQNQQAERLLLTALILISDPERTADIISRHDLAADKFSAPNLRTVFTAVTSLIDDQRQIDWFTLEDKLRELGTLERIGGRDMLFELGAEDVARIESVDEYAGAVVASHNYRVVYQIGQFAIEQAARGQMSAEDIAQDVAVRIERLSAGAGRVFDAPAVALSGWQSGLNNLIQRRLAGDDIFFTPTGFAELDWALSYTLSPGKMVVVAGPSSLGKTVVGTMLARNMAIVNTPAIYVPLEESEDDTWTRLISIYTGIPRERFMHADFQPGDHALIEQAVADFSRMPLIVCGRYRTAQGLSKLTRSVDRSLNRKGFVFVDNVNSIRDSETLNGGGNTNPNDLIATGIRELDILKVVTGWGVTALAQLREERPQSKSLQQLLNVFRPRFDQIANSSFIFRQADIVMLLYSWEYYAKRGYPQYEDREFHEEGELYIKIAKNRLAGIERFARLKWDKTGVQRLLPLRTDLPDSRHPSVFGIG